MFLLQLFAEICTALEGHGYLYNPATFVVPSLQIIFVFSDATLTLIHQGQTILFLSDRFPFAMHEIPLVPTVQSEVLLELAEIVNYIRSI